MRITVTCGSCGEDYSVKDELAGQRVKCKHCGEPNRVPSGASVASGGGRSRKGSGKKSGSSSSNDTPWIIAGVGGGAGLLIAIVSIVMVASNRGSQVVVQPPPPVNVAPIATTVPQVEPPPVAPVAQMAAQPVNEPPTEPVKKEPETLTLPDLIAQVEPSVVLLQTTTPDGGGIGSGYVVTADGMTITNHHVMAGAKTCTAKFADGTKVNCTGFRLLKPREDIAVIQLDLGGKTVKPLSIAESIPPKGTDVVGFGAPERLSFSTATGIISGIRDSDAMAEETGMDFDGTWIQTTCPISHGSSGGPLCDRQGRVVAMATLKSEADAQNLNFAISAIQIANAIKEAPEQVQPLDPEKIKDYDSSLASRGLPEEIGTERGKRLLSMMNETLVIDPIPVVTMILDPKRLIHSRALDQAKSALKRCQVNLIERGGASTASPTSGILLVMLSTEDSVAGRVGIQNLEIKMVLICKDPEATGRQGKLCIVWKDEEKLGSIGLANLARGQVPKTINVEEKARKISLRLESTVRANRSPGTGASPADAAAAPKNDPSNPFTSKPKKQ